MNVNRRIGFAMATEIWMEVFQPRALHKCLILIPLFFFFFDKEEILDNILKQDDGLIQSRSEEVAMDSTRGSSVTSCIGGLISESEFLMGLLGPNE